MTKGFKPALPFVTVKYGVMPGFKGAKIGCVMYQGSPFVEMISAANAVDKPHTDLAMWLFNSGLNAILAKAQKKQVELVSAEHYVQWLQYQAFMNQNAVAKSLLMATLDKGIQTKIDRAIAAGKDWITLPSGDILRFNEHGFLESDVRQSLDLSRAELDDLLYGID